MIRIEIEVCERTPGKIDMLCRSVQGCWSKPTDSERYIADKLVCKIRSESQIIGNKLGKVEEIKGEELERRSEFLFIDDPQTKKDADTYPLKGEVVEYCGEGAC